jgi:Omp85 superfamily domain
VLSGRIIRTGSWLLLLALAGSAGAASDSEEQASWYKRWLDPATAPFIPVPEIDVDPVGGTTFGLIPVLLTVDEGEEIRQIIAPDIIHSQYFGWGARGRIFSYPSKDTQWSVVGGGKQRVEREFDAIYLKGLARSSTWTWSLHANFDRSGTPRFYGVGNQTQASAQTNYVDNQGHLEANLGWNITQQWQTSYLLRMGFVQIGQAVLPQLPSIQTRFPQLTGLDREEELQQRVLVTYDTRDSITIPHSGEQLVLFGGFSDSDIWGSTSYTFIGGEARVYRPIRPWLTLATHAALRYMPSDDRAPFWALSSIGGDLAVIGERQPLRAFGQDRYVDRNSFAAGAELRARVAQFNVFATNLSLEVTPLVDVGKVFSEMGESPLSHLHKGTGVGFRAVASPFIVGYLDIGLGPEGPAIFTGINYPF